MFNWDEYFYQHLPENSKEREDSFRISKRIKVNTKW
jgi:hypothetical protein